MAQKTSSHSSSLFLLELILSILFFSIAAAICVQAFGKAHSLSRDAEVLSIAVNECSDAAEIILSADCMEDVYSLLTQAYPEIIQSDEKLCYSYDDTFQIIISYQLKSRMLHAHISFEEKASENSIYELSIEHFLQEELYD